MPRLFAYGHLLDLLPEDPDVRPERARLSGYRAAFVAASTTTWGTRANPAPILALVPGGSCRGLALDLAEERAQETLARWAGEEGADLALEATAEVGMPFRKDVVPVVTRSVIPAGPQALRALPVDRLARMAVVARGRRGTGVDYLRRLTELLGLWGLQEPVVAELWKEVQKERGERWR